MAPFENAENMASRHESLWKKRTDDLAR
jgi:hypothetical protein